MAGSILRGLWTYFESVGKVTQNELKNQRMKLQQKTILKKKKKTKKSENAYSIAFEVEDTPKRPQVQPHHQDLRDTARLSHRNEVVPT